MTDEKWTKTEEVLYESLRAERAARDTEANGFRQALVEISQGYAAALENALEKAVTPEPPQGIQAWSSTSSEPTYAQPENYEEPEEDEEPLEPVHLSPNEERRRLKEDDET